MAVRDIKQIGAPILYRKCEQVSFPLTPDDHVVVDDLIDTLHASDLVGLAAPQIGLDRRIFVIHLLRGEVSQELFECLNPEILSFSEETVVMGEGCGSIAQAKLFGEVERPAEIKVAYYNRQGERIERLLRAWPARVFQHELDHLRWYFVSHSVWKIPPSCMRGKSTTRKKLVSTILTSVRRLADRWREGV